MIRSILYFDANLGTKLYSDLKILVRLINGAESPLG